MINKREILSIQIKILECDKKKGKYVIVEKLFLISKYT